MFLLAKLSQTIALPAMGHRLCYTVRTISGQQDPNRPRRHMVHVAWLPHI